MFSRNNTLKSNIPKVDMRHPAAQARRLLDGFHGNPEAQVKYDTLVAGGVAAFREQFPAPSPVEWAIKETRFRGPLGVELEQPHERILLDLGEAATAELAEVIPIYRQSEPEVVSQPEFVAGDPRVVGHLIEDPREKIA